MSKEPNSPLDYTADPPEYSESVGLDLTTPLKRIQPSRPPRSRIASVSRFLHIDLQKPIDFKVQSSYFECRTLRLKYRTRHGFDRFKADIGDKLQVSLHREFDVAAFVLGYVDSCGDLISVTCEQDLLECAAHAKKQADNADAVLLAYDAKEHMATAARVKEEWRAQNSSLVTNTVRMIKDAFRVFMG
jgi:hypothetical protein